MQKLLRLLSLIVSVALFGSVLAACLNPSVSDERIMLTISQGTVTAEVGGETISFDTNANTVGQALDDLAAYTGIVFEYSSSIHGRMINALGELRPAANQFIAIYLSYNNPIYAFLLNYIVIDGVRLYSSMYGIDSLPVFEDVTYLFALSSM